MIERKGYHSLSRRIILQFCLFTVSLSIVYSFIAFVMMYTLEDSFIEKEIIQEAQQLSAEFEQTGTWPQPRSRHMQLYFNKGEFPQDIRQISIDAPRRKEFYGASKKHYHLHTLHGYDNVYLLAEVSELLHVRPIREDLITFLTISGLIVSSIACLIAWFIGRRTAKPLSNLAKLVDGVAPASIPAKFANDFPNNEVGILASALEQTLLRMAQALEREKCFTRDASHELRTPLAIIKNATELEITDEVVRRISDAAEEMDKTVQTLLVLAREEHSSAHKSKTEKVIVFEPPTC